MLDVRTVYGLMASAGFHSVVVGLLASGTLRSPEEHKPMVVVSQWAAHDSVDSVEFEVPIPVQEPCDFPVVAPPTAEPIHVTAGDLGRLLDGDLATPSDDAWSIGLPEGMLLGSGGGGFGQAGTATFFGTTVAGSRFVYVVDASRSMAGRRFTKAKRELFRSVANLRPDQQYYVIFFGLDSYPRMFPGCFSTDPNRIPAARSSRAIRRRGSVGSRGFPAGHSPGNDRRR